MKKSLLILITVAILHTHPQQASNNNRIVGPIVGKILARRGISPESYNSQDKKSFRHEVRQETRKHKKKVKYHQKKLRELEYESQEYSQAAQHHRDQIRYHESIIAEVEADLKSLFRY